MDFQHLTFNLVLLFLSLHFQSLVYGKLTAGKALRKQYIRKVNDHTETNALTSTRSNNTKGVRKDLVDSLVPLGDVQAPLFPVNIEHIRDYPVPVPVKHEIAENVLHVHIHDKNPCINGGYISQFLGGSYYCICPPHYSGETCQIQQFCFSGPCKNGGKCLEINQGYKCKCTHGFTGYNCEEELFCVPSPCEHGGKCVETIKGYKCICRDGFRGHHCQGVDFCYPNPCQHGGTCENINGGARCQCHPGYHGTHCHEKYVCYVNPCHNGGRCVENPVQPCHCSRGFVGTYCQDHVCQPDPCLHGGSCTVTMAHPLGLHNNRWTYHCICSQYYRGRNCQIPHPCIDQPCLNGGTCIDTYFNDNAGREQYNGHDLVTPSINQEFFCLCPLGFSGPRCGVVVCSLCHPDADCVNHRCVCKPHFIGDGIHCKNVSSHCNPNPCYHGTCSEGPDGSYDCECFPGYCGPQCKDICRPCLLWPCSNGGQCIPKGDKRICICRPPYQPPDCNVTEPDRCKPNPCKNGGKCTFLADKNDYICNCLGNFGGKDCSECDCPKAVKIKGKMVVDSICDNIGECICPEIEGVRLVFTAKNGCVESGGGPCERNPCQRGDCVNDDNEPEGFRCANCPSPYFGRLCECTTCTCENPCKNGATCQDISTRQYKCICPPGFTGDDCSVRAVGGHCNLRKCKNGGTCVERLNGYDCICTPQFTGPHCGVDKCANCDVNADCIYGRCRCRRGYIGTGYVCAEVDKEPSCGVCPLHHQCMRGMCICLPGFIC